MGATDERHRLRSREGSVEPLIRGKTVTVDDVGDASAVNIGIFFF
jgi:hypothetical protein